MSNIQAVSASRYSGKYWKRFSSYTFAAQESVVILATQELSKAIMSLPIAFVPVGERFMPAAFLGLLPNKNLFVLPDGRWLPGNYVPAQLRSYPFMLAKTESGDKALCIDEASGLVTEDPADVAFFSEGGVVSEPTQDLLSFLEQVTVGQEHALNVCDVLSKHHLIQPWPVTIKVEGGEDKTIQGLYRIDTAALDQLNAEALFELKQSGALSVAYCQVLSAQHFSKLGDLMQLHAELNQPAPTSGELDLEFLNQSDTISF